MMKKLLLTLLFGILGVGVYGQTIKSLGYNTTNGQIVANTGTNVLTFTNDFVKISTISAYVGDLGVTADNVLFDATIEFTGTNVNQHIANTRANLGFSTNLNTLWTATNSSNARSAVGLGATWLTNMAGGVGSAIIGSGPNNTVSGSGNLSVIVGGRDHAVSGGLSVVLGGRSNEVTANYSIAAGTAAKAVHSGSFVFADYRVNAPDLISFSSTNDNSFNVRAAGGMSLDLGTNGIIFRTNVSADATRTNLGLGWSALTNTNAANFRTEIGLGATNQVQFSTVNASSISANVVEIAQTLFVGDGAGLLFDGEGAGNFRTNLGLGSFTSDEGFSVIADESNNAVISTENGIPLFHSALTFTTTNAAATTRTNLGLGAAWLTNANVTNFRTAIGLGINDTVTLAYGTDAYIGQDGGGLYVDNFYPEFIQCGQFGIGFGTTNSAATTRTNLGLGGGITTNRTFVSYNGTNYTTNSVTISNGIITGWTQ